MKYIILYMFYFDILYQYRLQRPILMIFALKKPPTKITFLYMYMCIVLYLKNCKSTYNVFSLTVILGLNLLRIVLKV